MIAVGFCLLPCCWLLPGKVAIPSVCSHATCLLALPAFRRAVNLPCCLSLLDTSLHFSRHPLLVRVQTKFAFSLSCLMLTYFSPSDHPRASAPARGARTRGHLQAGQPGEHRTCAARDACDRRVHPRRGCRARAGRHASRGRLRRPPRRVARRRVARDVQADAVGQADLPEVSAEPHPAGKSAAGMPSLAPSNGALAVVVVLLSLFRRN